MSTEVLNISPFVAWVLALSVILNFALSVWGLLASGSRTNARKLEGHSDQLTAHNGRIAAIEVAQREMPTGNDMHVLEMSMSKLQGSLDVLTERLKPLKAMTERMQEWMMEFKGK